MKEKLISVGIEEIRTNGIDRMSMRTIAQKCGVTHGAPYKHFGSKDRYIQVVMEHLSMFFLKNMILGIDTSIDARTQLTLMGCNFVRFAQEETYLFEAVILPFTYASKTERAEIKRLELAIQMGTEERQAYDPVDLAVDIYQTVVLPNHYGLDL